MRFCKKGGAVLLTADHGNAEKMRDEGPASLTPLTPPMVPFSLIINDGIKHSLRDDGILADVAPTALELLHIPQPQAMTEEPDQ